jgi:transcriptional regulator GlxA family with amidase domain
MIVELLSKEDGGSQYVKEHVREAILFMNEHYMEPLTRDALAEHVSLSPGYFSVAFKQVTGQSPIQYLSRIRMDRAKSLLKMSKLPVSQVAIEVGITDPFYFSRIFTSYVGMPPRDFRNG